jgi:SAM-dependent methyltransferase
MARHPPTESGLAPLPGVDPGEKQYVLGTDQAELDRLGLQHRLWADAAHALWRRAGIQPGQRVLDVGCGPGYGAFDLAALVAGVAGQGPRGEVFGVDQSGGFIQWLNAQAAVRGLTHLKGLVGDVMDLPGVLSRVPGVAPSSFDAAYARWVLCFIPDPAAAVRGVATMLRPGGVFCVQDYFNYEALTTAPRGQAFARAVKATGESWRARGGDPDLVGRLPELMRRAGLKVVHLNTHQRIARPGEQMWHWPASFWRNFVPQLVKMGLLPEGFMAEWEREWAELERNPDAFCVLPVVYDVIAVKQ